MKGVIYKVQAFAGDVQWVCRYAGNKKTADKIALRLSRTFRTVVVEKVGEFEAEHVNEDWIERIE